MTRLADSIDYVRELQWGMTKECAEQYCVKIKKVAIREYDIDNNSISFKVINFREKIGIEFSLKDQEKLDCIRTIVQTMISAMPVTARPPFEKLLKLLRGASTT